MKLFYFLGLLSLCSCQLGQDELSASRNFQDWQVYHGDATASHYSSLAQVNQDNVAQLELAWSYETGDADNRSQIQCNAIIIDTLLFATSPQLKVFALDARTGVEQWVFDPFQEKAGSGVNRGVTFWQSDTEKRILFTAGTFLYALDAQTGLAIETFGQNGRVDLRKGLDRERGDLEVIATSPGIVYKDLLILGSRVSEGERSAPGHIRAFDVRSGAIKWIFHTIPHPDEFAYDTWPKAAYQKVGGANAWSGFSLDEKRGLLFAPVGSPSFDFHGGNRHGDNLFGNSIVALEAKTGKRIWHFQTIHHDLWDRDLPCQANLVSVEKGGKKIDALAQVTKHGVVFLFNRENGELLFEVEEKEVPGSRLKNEETSLTQPFPVQPAPFSGQVFTADLITDRTPEATAYVQGLVKNMEFGNKFTPPSTAGTIIYPGFDGGADWGGAAVEPDRGVLYINSSEMAWIHQMVELDAKGTAMTPGRLLYDQHCATCHATDRSGQQHLYPALNALGERLTRTEAASLLETGKGRMPGYGFLTEEEKSAVLDFIFDQEEKKIIDWASERGETEADPPIPYSFTGYNKLKDQEGYPGIKPPWGTLNAIDLNTGEYLWKIPFGTYPELENPQYANAGSESYGGPVVTAGGLLFIAATPDKKFRAFNKDSGTLLWETELPFAGFATPSIYMIEGKQYIVIAAGGGKLGATSGGQYLAFSLPD